MPIMWAVRLLYVAKPLGGIVARDAGSANSAPQKDSLSYGSLT